MTRQRAALIVVLVAACALGLWLMQPKPSGEPLALDPVRPEPTGASSAVPSPGVLPEPVANTTPLPSPDAVRKVAATLTDDDAISRLIESYVQLCEERKPEAAETALAALMEKRATTERLAQALLGSAADADGGLAALSRVRLVCLFVLAGERAWMDALAGVIALWDRETWDESRRKAWERIVPYPPGEEARAALPEGDSAVIACVCAAVVHADSRNAAGAVGRVLASLAETARLAKADTGPVYDPVLSAVISNLHNHGRKPGVGKENLGALLVAIRANRAFSHRLHVQAAKLLTVTSASASQLVDDLNKALSTADASLALAQYVKSQPMTGADWELIVAALVNRWEPHELSDILVEAMERAGRDMFADGRKGQEVTDALLSALPSATMTDTAAIRTVLAVNILIGSCRTLGAWRAAQGDDRDVVRPIREGNPSGEQVIARIRAMLERSASESIDRAMILGGGMRLLMNLSLPIARRLEVAVELLSAASTDSEVETVSVQFLVFLKFCPERELEDGGAALNSAIAKACRLLSKAPKGQAKLSRAWSLRHAIGGMLRCYLVTRLPSPTSAEAQDISSLLDGAATFFAQLNEPKVSKRDLTEMRRELERLRPLLHESYPSAFAR